MKIELKNIKYSEFASHETSCYEATIYIDGKKAGIVENDGRGGCDHVTPWQLADEIDAYAKTLPPVVSKWIDPDTGKPAEMEQTHETIFGDILTDWLHAKDLKRAMSRCVMFTREDGRLYQATSMKKAALAKYLSESKLREALRAKEILNLLPFDRALEIYKQGAAA
jgi:hypothetical protein